MSQAKFAQKIDPKSPAALPFKAGKIRAAVAGWTFEDVIRDGSQVRIVKHYSTPMAEFVLTAERAARFEAEKAEAEKREALNGWAFTPVSACWMLVPLSNGWYSVSDQNGCSALGRRYGLSFNRNGVKAAERKGIEPAQVGAGWVALGDSGAARVGVFAPLG